MRSIWTGSISFGLINIPIKIFSAVQESSLDLDILDSKDHANKLVEQFTEKFNIENYKDTYTAKLLKIIKEKSKGKKTSVPKMKLVHKQNDDLMDMLKASLSTKKNKSA